MIKTAGSKRKVAARAEVVVLGFSGGQARVFQAAVRGSELAVEKWASAPAGPDDELRARAAVQALAQAGIRERRVTVCLPASWITMKRVQLPPASPEQIPQLVAYEAQRHLPLPLDQLASGYQQLESTRPNGKPPGGAQTEVLLAVTRKSDLSRLERALSEAGLTVEGYGIEPLALTDAYLGSSAHTGGSRLLLAPEDSGVHVQVLRDSQLLFARYVSSNGDDWTGSVRRSLAAYSMEHPEVQLGEATLLGDGDRGAVEHALGRPVEHARGEGAYPAEYAPLAGAARQVLGLGRYPLRLPPQGWHEAKPDAGRSRTLLAVLAAAALVVLLIGWQVSRARARAAEATEAARVTRMAERDQKVLDGLRQEQEQLKAQLAALGGGGGTLPLDLLSEVASRAPRSVWLTQMTYQAGKPLQLQGTAREASQVTEFHRRLEGLPAFSRAELGFIRSATVEETPVTQFRIDCYLAGEPDAPRATPDE